MSATVTVLFFNKEWHRRNHLYTIMVAIALAFTTSCDCVQNASGLVFDKVTRKPIDSVFINKSDREYEVYSDSTGAFKISGISGGLLGCPLMKISFHKKGYQSVEKEISHNKDTVFLKKIR